MPIPIDVCEINSHREMARATHREVWQRVEMAFAIVDPDAVRRLKIVADVEIGKTITIDVAKHR